MKLKLLIIAVLFAALIGCGGNNPLSAVNARAQADARSKPNLNAQSLSLESN